MNRRGFFVGAAAAALDRRPAIVRQGGNAGPGRRGVTARSGISSGSASVKTTHARTAADIPARQFARLAGITMTVTSKLAEPSLAQALEIAVMRRARRIGTSETTAPVELQGPWRFETCGSIDRSTELWQTAARTGHAADRRFCFGQDGETMPDRIRIAVIDDDPLFRGRRRSNVA